MAGLTQLSEMLSTLSPELDQAHYVFATVHSGEPLDALNPLFIFREAEGDTVVLSKTQATVAGFDTGTVFARITLKVHSSLAAVGLTAAVSAALTDHQIPANVVAAYYHDHLFVPADRAQEALAVLEALSLSAQRDSPA